MRGLGQKQASQESTAIETSRDISHLVQIAIPDDDQIFDNPS
jgi:hypothetical protein